MIYNVNNSYLYYENNFEIINDYHQMIVDLIKKILNNNKNIKINVTLCKNNYNFNNENKTIKININWEHTIVKQGGRSVQNNTPFGAIKYHNDNNNDINDDNNYLIRIDRYNELNDADIVIDYSLPNIHNVMTNDIFKSFSNKHIIIYSSIYEPYFFKENRNIPILTTFINTNEHRRAVLLKNMNDVLTKNGFQFLNVNNCFIKNDLQHLYKNTKILINIHQTEHHHTFEELRVLPALQCGVIVISENSPLSELVPYNDYIIWTSYDKILEKTIEIINNYDYFHDLIFVKDKNKKLDQFNDVNYNTLEKQIIKCAAP